MPSLWFRLCFLFCAALPLACAETVPPSPAGLKSSPEQPSVASLFETAKDARDRRIRQRATALETSLESLPGVIEVRVHLTTPNCSPFGKTCVEKGGAAVLVVRDNQNTPTDKELKAFVLAAIPELTPTSVMVLSTQKAQSHPPKTVAIGPIEVTQTTATITRLILGGLLVLCLLASTGLISAGIKLRRLRHTGK